MGYILDSKNVIGITNYLRSRGKKIVFTHGTFDLFHVGHMAFLKKSRELGEILVVGIEGDRWTSIIKGRDRPLFPADYRLGLISELKDVDFVFQTGDSRFPRENYYIDLYRRIHPNIVTFGSNFDYKKQFQKKANYVPGTGYIEVTTRYNRRVHSTFIIRQIIEEGFSR